MGDYAIQQTSQPGTILARLEQLQECSAISGDLSLNPGYLGVDREVSFPLLKSVGGQLYMSGATTISAYRFPVLTRVGARLIISDNPNLGAVFMPALTSVRGALQITFSNDLTGVSLPVLATVGGLSLQGNTVLASLELPAVTAMNGALYVGGSSALTTLSMPTLASAKYSFFIEQNSGLSTLNLPALRSVQGYPLGLAFVIRNNAALPQCHAQEILNQLTDLVGSTDVSGNGPGSCP